MKSVNSRLTCTYVEARRSHTNVMRARVTVRLGACRFRSHRQGSKTRFSTRWHRRRRIAHSIRAYCSGLIVISHN